MSEAKESKWKWTVLKTSQNKETLMYLGDEEVPQENTIICQETTAASGHQSE